MPNKMRRVSRNHLVEYGLAAYSAHTGLTDKVWPAHPAGLSGKWCRFQSRTTTVNGWTPRSMNWRR